MKVKRQLLEYLIRECVREVLEQTSSETIGAPAPPAEGQGTADAPAIPKVKKPKYVNETRLKIDLAKIKEGNEQQISPQLKILKQSIKNVIRELFSTDAKDQEDAASQTSIGLDNVATKELSPIERAKIEREKEMARKDAIKRGEEELKTAKAEMDFQKKKLDQNKRFKVPALQKQLQTLKGGIGGM